VVILCNGLELFHDILIYIYLLELIFYLSDSIILLYILEV
jgi:hypothetical protein